MLTIIVYIPPWEYFLEEWFQSLQWLWSRYKMVVISDGKDSPRLDQSITAFVSQRTEGPIEYISIFVPQIQTENTLLLRQGFPLTKALFQNLLEEKRNAVAISYSSNESFSDDCLLFSTKTSLPIWKKVNNLLFSGYGTYFQALLHKTNLETKTISFRSEIQFPVQKPTLYNQQQMSNVLTLLLAELNSNLQLPADFPKPQTEKISIVVLVWNNLKVTIPCLLSIMKFTKHPFELIIIDNGSTEPVKEWVEKNLGRFKNVMYHRNEINQGFPQGCNEGMARATGEHILLLNNDTIVTPFWLTRQVAAFSDPKVGIVGPISINNNTNQNVLSLITRTNNKPLYSNPKEMIIFSNLMARNSLGIQPKNGEVVGLCFMIRKDVWQKLGGMDPIYGFGNFEDSDYNYRTHRIGYESVVCLDVFIDHAGSSTFKESRIPYNELIFLNLIYSFYKHNISLGTDFFFANFDALINKHKNWKNNRSGFEEQDCIPFHIHEYLANFEPLSHPFPKEKTVLAYPSIYEEEWIPSVLKAIQLGWKIILRIDPPTPHLEERFSKQIKTLDPEIQEQIYLDVLYLPTIKRGAIYERVSGVLQLPRFDWFRLEREAKAINLPIIQI